MPRIIKVDFDKNGKRLVDVVELTKEQLEDHSMSFVQELLPEIDQGYVEVRREPFWQSGNILMHENGRMYIHNPKKPKFRNLTPADGSMFNPIGPFIITGEMNEAGFTGYSEEIDECFDDDMPDVERLADYIESLPHMWVSR